MSKSTISTFELFTMFPDAESARLYFEAKRWPDGPVCPACGETKRIYAKGGGYYRCNADLSVFTVRTGTIFERSKVPLHKWLYAMYLLVTARKGISSLQLAKQIGVSQPTAWFVLMRLREACGNDPTKLAGIVECDETYIGGREDVGSGVFNITERRGVLLNIVTTRDELGAHTVLNVAVSHLLPDIPLKQPHHMQFDTGGRQLAAISEWRLFPLTPPPPAV